MFADSIVKLFSLGVIPGLDHEDRARIVVLNAICVGVAVILIITALSFSVTGSYVPLRSLVVVPLLVAVPWLHKQLRFNAAKFTFTYGILAALFILAITNRRVGAEYGLIAIACSSAFTFRHRYWVIATFAVACLLYIVYLAIDRSYPFYREPTLNYPLISTIYMLLSGSVVFFEMLIFRLIIRKYADSFEETNQKLNRTNEQLNAVNEDLDGIIKERTRALENKTEELLAQKEKLNEVVRQLDRNNAKLNTTVKALQQRNYEMDQIIYRLSHNLKAPLCSIAGLNNLMKIDLNMEMVGLALPKIDQKIHEMENVFRSVASLTAINQVEVTPSEFSPEVLVDEVVARLSRMQGASEVMIKTDHYAHLLCSDQKMLSTAFHHIIRNAIMFRSKDRRSYLEIAFEPRDGGCRIFFKDNGVGIPDRIKDRIFDMFFQGSALSNGAGLGLYITREIVRRLGGDIAISSHESGTVVAVYIPTMEAERPVVPIAGTSRRIFPVALLRGA